ncbi:NADH:ubiquinone oxidoreductase [Aphelenchoides avenae]|nr:NADH:ubiquinone oxidoreductase [Aphelenchus avenae]
MDKIFPDGEGRHPTLKTPHKKFANYSFGVEEFMRLINQSTFDAIRNSSKSNEGLEEVMSRPAPWSRVWQLFVESLTRTRAKRYIGEDSFGNRYYELPQTKTNVTRGFDPPEGHPHPSLPTVEWQSWLKGTRKLPPSPEEIRMNMARQQAQQLQDARTEQNAPRIDSKGKGAHDIDRPKNYPMYEGTYEQAPGARKDDSNT